MVINLETYIPLCTEHELIFDDWVRSNGFLTWLRDEFGPFWDDPLRLQGRRDYMCAEDMPIQDEPDYEAILDALEEEDGIVHRS